MSEHDFDQALKRCRQCGFTVEEIAASLERIACAGLSVKDFNNAFAVKTLPGKPPSPHVLYPFVNAGWAYNVILDQVTSNQKPKCPGLEPPEPWPDPPDPNKEVGKRELSDKAPSEKINKNEFKPRKQAGSIDTGPE